MAEEFSKNALAKHRKTGQPMRCKQCTAKQEQEERDKAKASSTATAGTPDDTAAEEETRACAGSCQQVLPQSAYNRNQWAKGEGKSRCRACVEQSIQEEASQQSKSKQDKIEQARKQVEALKLDKKATPQQVIKAESELAALEAEKVTGLKPVKMSRGGRGRGRFGGSGRGRGKSSRR